MSREAGQGYVSWLNQRRRCDGKDIRKGKGYFSKGIKVRYGVRDYVGWWLHNLSLRDWKRPTCGRIDHDGDYCFENIEMQEMGDNSKERFHRCGRTGGTIPKLILAKKNGRPFGIFADARAAARSFNLTSASVRQQANGKRGPSRNGMSYEFVFKKDG